MELKDYRKQIDRIDKELMALLKERFDVSAAIGAYKREKGIPVLDAQREAEIIESLYERLASEDVAENKSRHLVEVMKAIMTESRNYQAEAGPEYGLLGRRLSHSFSPRLHMDFGEYDYVLIEKEPEELAAYIRGGSFKGINVTIPYKREVMPLCDRITDIAKESISVNTIYRDDEGRLIGDNTDYYGFTYMLKRENIEAEGRKALVLGSGGVSGTVRKALYDMGAREVVIISRSGTDNYENIGRHADAELIVNATPVGMYPDNGSCVIDVSAFPKLEAVADLVYNPLRTQLVLDCIDLGIKACGGLSMLVAQGAKAVELFTGKSISDYDIESEIAKLEREMG